MNVKQEIWRLLDNRQFKRIRTTSYKRRT